MTVAGEIERVSNGLNQRLPAFLLLSTDLYLESHLRTVPPVLHTDKSVKGQLIVCTAQYESSARRHFSARNILFI